MVYENNIFFTKAVSNTIVSFFRLYSTHKLNGQFRRLICYLTYRNDPENLNVSRSSIFLQYIGYPMDFAGTVNLLEPYGNTKKITPPFTSTIPSVIASIKVSFNIYLGDYIWSLDNFILVL